MSGPSAVPIPNCALCGSDDPLRQSHIIPRFVFAWLLESSATGHMRFGRAPNLRVQDGFKQALLCDGCERRFSAWEDETARSIFRPYHQDTSAVLQYAESFAKFCASVCWRVLCIFRSLGINNFSPEQSVLADKALIAWSDFMFGRVPDPAPFELHLLPVDIITDATGAQLPPNSNRYLARAIEIDAVSSDTSAYVYVKMCKFIVLGFVQMSNNAEWQGTSVATEGGTIQPADLSVPGGFSNYLIERACNMAALQSRISPRQRNRIDSAMRSNPERAATSETLAAMSQDVAMFGDLAFESSEDESAEND